MLHLVSVRFPPSRSTFIRDELSADLARFSLDPSLAGVEPWRYGPRAPWPSPPMSGSPPPPDPLESSLADEEGAEEEGEEEGEEEEKEEEEGDEEEAEGEPDSRHELRRSARRAGHGHPSTAEAVPEPRRPSYEARRSSVWSTLPPSTSSVSLLESPPAPFLPALRSDPHPERGDALPVPTPAHQTSAFNPRISPRSSRTTPRRTKAHVPSACKNCRMAHLRCEGMSDFLLVCSSSMGELQGPRHIMLSACRFCSDLSSYG